MKRIISLVPIIALLAAPAFAADVSISVEFVAPPVLVVVEPGVQVVEDHDDDIFYVDGWYWVSRNDRWYRTHDHKGQWVFVEVGSVPRTIVVVPRGKYKRYKHHKENHDGDKHSNDGKSGKGKDKRGKGNKGKDK